MRCSLLCDCDFFTITCHGRSGDAATMPRRGQAATPPIVLALVLRSNRRRGTRRAVRPPPPPPHGKKKGTKTAARLPPLTRVINNRTPRRGSGLGQSPNLRLVIGPHVDPGGRPSPLQRGLIVAERLAGISLLAASLCNAPRLPEIPGPGWGVARFDPRGCFSLIRSPIWRRDPLATEQKSAAAFWLCRFTL